MRGFQPKNITPYWHSLMTHADEVVKEVGPLDDHNGESLEKENDEFKNSHLRQTNCKDICETLRIQKRREMGKRNEAIRVKAKQAARGNDGRSQVSFALKSTC